MGADPTRWAALLPRAPPGRPGGARSPARSVQSGHADPPRRRPLHGPPGRLRLHRLDADRQRPRRALRAQGGPHRQRARGVPAVHGGRDAAHADRAPGEEGDRPLLLEHRLPLRRRGRAPDPEGHGGVRVEGGRVRRDRQRSRGRQGRDHPQDGTPPRPVPDARRPRAVGAQAVRRVDGHRGRRARREAPDPLSRQDRRRPAQARPSPTWPRRSTRSSTGAIPTRPRRSRTGARSPASRASARSRASRARRPRSPGRSRRSRARSRGAGPAPFFL